MKANNTNVHLTENQKGARKYLGVNIDHVATLRQARGTSYPSVVQAALVAEMAGADQITLHLREDRRHIQDRDVWQLREQIQTRMNFEMAVTDFMVDFAKKVKPEICCLVPEKREELTTEGGLDVKSHFEAVKAATHALMDADMEVSLFIDADFTQIDAAFETGANAIEIHTGAYADAKGKAQEAELQKIIQGVAYAHEKGLIVNVGHGLHYHNILPVAAIPNVVEYNIGHAIIARAIFVGLDTAVREIKAALV